MLERAMDLTPTRVFPFRAESAPVLAWAAQQRPGWQATYYLALVRAWNGDSREALALLEALGDVPAFAPLYALRAQLRGGVSDSRAALDWERAMKLEPTEWRYGRVVAERLLEEGRGDSAAVVARRYLQAGRSRPSLDLLYARAQLRTGRFAEVASFMDRLEVLPAEGAAEAHAVYREANLLSAVHRLNAREPSQALPLIEKARQWPERLGSGKPYAADVDERLEDWLAARAHELAGDTAKAAPLLERVARFQGRGNQGDTLTALARARLGLPPGGGGGRRGDNMVNRVLRALSW
jgi:hypothetical protein